MDLDRDILWKTLVLSPVKYWSFNGNQGVQIILFKYFLLKSFHFSASVPPSITYYFWNSGGWSILNYATKNNKRGASCLREMWNFVQLFLQIFTQDTHEFQDRQSKLSNLSKILSEIIKLVFYQFIQLSFDHNIYWVRFYTKEKIYSLCDKLFVWYGK
jgi:hypothetical protein